MQRNDILKLLFETPYEALRERADEVRAVRILDPLRPELPILRPAFGESVPETLPS